MAYDKKTDYQAKINEAKAKGDAAAAAKYEAQRNEKIADMNNSGSNTNNYTPTYDYSGNSGNSGGRTGTNNTNSVDYSTILKDLIGNNPGNYNDDIVSMVQNALDSRSNKIASDPSLAKYANDDIMLAAQQYLNSASNWKTSQNALAALQDIPEYDSLYGKDIKSLVAGLMSKEDFNYNFMQDPSFQAYSNQFDLLGDRAMADTLADVSGNTGGLASSAAVSAAAQAKNNWNSKLTDVIPTLMEAAYSRYQNGINTDMSLLGTISGLDTNAYNQYADQKNSAVSSAQWLANYGYNASRDQVADNQYDQAFNYQVSRDKVLDEQWLKGFSADEQQRIIDNAINNRQISVSEGNLALSRAKFDYEQDTTEDTAHYGGMYAEMMASPDPQKWLTDNASYLTAEEIAWLKKQMGSTETTGYFD